MPASRMRSTTRRKRVQGGKGAQQDVVGRGEGCIREGSRVAGGGDLSGLEYSEEHRCYLAPAEVLSRQPGTTCFFNPWHP